MTAPDARFEKAVSEFNRGDYFEAHEIWEEIWKETEGELRRFYQGLIQIAAGYHKLPRLHLRGARTLLSRGVEKLEKFPARFMGLEVEALRQAVGEDLRRLTGLDEARFSRSLLLWPRIALSGEPGPEVRTPS